MAQPVFDGHPLEEYFKDSGEVPELMPGGIADIALQPYLTSQHSVSKHAERMERLCFLVLDAVESLSSCFSSGRTSLRTRAFAERFKYGVISSSLLSSAFPATSVVEPHRRALSPSLPGKLSNGHSRTPSAAESTMTDTLSLSMPHEPDTPIWPVTLSFTVIIAALSARFYSFTLLLLATTLYYMHVHRLDIHPKPDVMTPSLLALQHLVAAGRLWDTVINDTFTILESEEQNIFYGSATPRSPSSPLRVALSTSLLTTQTQCDNVRQLLSAITSPSELAQLAEMYAPPSPIKPTFTRSSDVHRPLSHPGSPRGTPMTDRMRKRSTWNGSYTSLAQAGMSPTQALRREKRRSDLSALLGNTSPSPARIRSRNAPSSPPQLLADVSEEEEGMVTAESSVAGDEDDNTFGTAALGLYRHRVRQGLRSLELSHRSMPLSLTPGEPRRRPPTMSPGSKYTSMHTTRHPLSLSSLRHALQNALASKRFACSHLLALRFEDDEDEVYWEDVRAVMGLLTSTLADASSRLSEVLEEVEERRLKAEAEDGVEGSLSGCDTSSSLASPPVTRTRLLPLSSTEGGSFAPTPTHWARFAAHVEAIGGALEDAREALGRCVAAVREGEEQVCSPGHSSHPSTASSGEVGAGPGTSAYTDPTDHPAIQAYDRLRRELGLALRECERGRERLVCIVVPPTPTTSEEPCEDACGEAAGPEGGKAGTSADGIMQGNADAEVDGEELISLAVHPPSPDADADADADAGAEPLSNPLAPPIEQELVYEAEPDPSGGSGSMRNRNRLSREERIRLVRAKREAPPPPPSERWGPSGDVVQELKDVIWKVGQRRRELGVTAGPEPGL